jgi:hypothetical protein
MATPLLTATPGAAPTYNPSMAETFSWIPVEGAGRPLFAQATYLANPEDIKVSLSADNINVDLGQIELNTDNIEELITDSNTRLDVLTAVDYATSAKQDLTNTLLDALTAKETTISLDVSAINLNTDEIEGKLNTANNNLESIKSDTVQINNSYMPLMVADLDEIRINTEFGTTSNTPLFVNPGALVDTVDSVSIDKSIGQTATTALTSKVYVSGSRKVYNLFGISTAGTDQYIQLYNTNTSTPTGTPIGVFFVPANSNFSFDLNRGLNFTNNVLIVNSITPVTYTQGNNDLFITVIHN